MLVTAQIPGVLENLLSIQAQVLWIRIAALLKPILAIVGIFAITLAMNGQVRNYRQLALSQADRARARLMGSAFLVSLLPVSVFVVVQSVLILSTGRKVIGAVPIARAVRKLNLVDPTGEMVRCAEQLGITFGRS